MATPLVLTIYMEGLFILQKSLHIKETKNMRQSHLWDNKIHTAHLQRGFGRGFSPQFPLIVYGTKKCLQQQCALPG